MTPRVVTEYSRLVCLGTPPSREAQAGTALDDLAEIHALTHAQGGHMQIQQSVPTGTSLHVFFRAAEPEQRDERHPRSRATVTRFPFVRLREPREPG